jgi:hypothetical protein
VASTGDSLLALILKSGAWIALILAVFVPVSIRVYRKT